jgi:hypothetical protein
LSVRSRLAAVVLVLIASLAPSVAIADHSTALRIVAVGPDYVDLAWTAPDGAIRYDVMSSSNGGASWSLVAKVPYYDPKQWRAAGLWETTWHFKVVAVFWSGTHGNTSNVVSTRVPAVCNIAPAQSDTAIEAAVAGCPEHTVVRFPAGAAYTVADRIELRGLRNRTIDGNGSTFVSTYPNVEALQPVWMFVDAENLSVRNLTAEGQFKLAGPRSPATVGGMAGNQFNAGIAVYGGRNITVAEVSARDTFGDGVIVAPSGILPGGAGPTAGVGDNVRIQRASVTRTARQGVAITGGTNIWLEDSTFDDIWYWAIDAESDAVGQPLRDVHILRNTIHGAYFGAITVPAPGGPGDVDRGEIRGNRQTVVADAPGVSPIIINYWGSDPPVMQHVDVIGNEVRTTYDGIVYTDVVSGLVEGNTIHKVTGPGYNEPPPAQPVRLVRSPGVTVGANTAIGY